MRMMQSLLSIVGQTIKLNFRSGAFYGYMLLLASTVSTIFFFSGTDLYAVSELPLRTKYALWSLFGLLSVLLIWQLCVYHADSFLKKLFHLVDVTPVSRTMHLFGRFLGFYILSVLLFTTGLLTLLICAFIFIDSRPINSIESMFNSVIAVAPLDPVSDREVEIRVEQVLLKNPTLKDDEVLRTEIRNELRIDKTFVLPNRSLQWVYNLENFHAKKGYIESKSEGQSPYIHVESQWQLIGQNGAVMQITFVPFMTKENIIVPLSDSIVSKLPQRVTLKFTNDSQMALGFPLFFGPFLYLEKGSFLLNVVTVYGASLMWLFSFCSFVFLMSVAFDFAIAVIVCFLSFFMGFAYDYFHDVLTTGIGKTFLFSSMLDYLIFVLTAFAPPAMIDAITKGRYIDLFSNFTFLLTQLILIIFSWLLMTWIIRHKELEKEGRNE